MCEALIYGDSSGLDAANNFVDNPNVMIRENNGRDDVIDALLSPTPQTTLYIDLSTTDDDINRYIESNTGKSLNEGLRYNYDNKINSVLSSLETEIKNQISMANGVSRASKFLRSEERR